MLLGVQSDGARWFLSQERRSRGSRRRQFTRLNSDETVFDFVRIFEQPALRRTGGTRAVAVIRSAVAWAHEQTGLRKPADWAAQVRAIDRENLELIAGDAPDPARRVYCLAIRRSHVGISKCRQPRLPFRKLADRSKRHPGEVGVRASASNRGQKEAHERYGQRGRH